MQFITPHNLQEALKVKASAPEHAILAGGTDLMVQWKAGAFKPKGIISIWNLDELRKICQKGDEIEIGALATHAEIINNKIIQRHLPVLADACATIGAVQIQNRGTIGGNVMNASPAGDTLPVLLAYDADVELTSLKGTRRVPFGKFFAGYRKTVVARDELVTKFYIKKPPKKERAAFIKIGTRKAQAISKVCGFFRKNFGDYKIAFGSVAPIPIRCLKIEDFLNSNKIQSNIIDQAVKVLEKEIVPIDDIRSKADYRRHVCGILLKRFLLAFA